jgi:single-strand DNA-binding protein
MASFNRVILVGNLTRDVEIKYLQSGTAVTEIGLACNNRRKNQQTGEWIEEPVFVDITLWGRTAELAGEYLGKGSNVLIEGRLKYDTWEKDGQKHSKLRVVGETMQFLGAPRGASGSGGGGGGVGGGSRSQRPAQQRSPQQFNEAEYQPSADDFGGSQEPRATAPAGAPPEDIPF